MTTFKQCITTSRDGGEPSAQARVTLVERFAVHEATPQGMSAEPTWVCDTQSDALILRTGLSSYDGSDGLIVSNEIVVLRIGSLTFEVPLSAIKPHLPCREAAAAASGLRKLTSDERKALGLRQVMT